MVDKRLIEKYEKEAKEKNRDSWYLAYIMDVNEEERVKGKTVEVGRAMFSTSKKRYTILDAPGHKSYVPNMISGASQADVGILVISARKGEFETGFERGGQTREHAMLAKTLGIGKLIVVVNKMDEATVQWSKDRFEEVQNKLNPYLKSVGFNLKKNVTYIPISGYTGANITKKVDSAVCSWYDGSYLIEALDDLPPLSRDESGPMRMPIVDCYKYEGKMNLLGKLESGTLVINQKLVVLPSSQKCVVVGINVNEKEVQAARPGENLIVSVKGVEEGYVHPGYVLSSRKDPPLVSSVFIAKVVITELLPHKPLISKGYYAVLHLHSVIVECEIVELIAEYDKKTQKVAKNKPAFVKNGSIVDMKIKTESPVCLENFDVRPQLGRFTLRDEGKTIAIGKVSKIGQKKKAEEQKAY
jgi:peptide chain release factor subunit 3